MKNILLIADTPGWIFERHCNEIKKRLPQYNIDIKFSWTESPYNYKYDQYNVVYQLDPMGIGGLRPPSEKTILGLRNEFMYNNADENSIHNFYKSQIEPRCTIFHVVNKNQYNKFKKYSNKLYLVQHGVDTDCFKKKNKEKHKKLVIGCSGNAQSSGEKGFNFVEEACRNTDCDLLTAKQNLYNGHLNKEQMADYYNKIDIYVCMSKTEGLNNCIMEAGASGVPVITTKTGAVEEMITNNVNGFIIDRNVHDLSDRILLFKNHIDKIEEFGNLFMENIRKNWSWNTKINEYNDLFNLI